MELKLFSDHQKPNLKIHPVTVKITEFWTVKSHFVFEENGFKESHVSQFSAI